MIYTVNPVEALHRIIREVSKTQVAWNNDKTLLKQLYLTLTYNEKSWESTVFNLKVVQLELPDQFAERYDWWLEN